MRRSEREADGRDVLLLTRPDKQLTPNCAGMWASRPARLPLQLQHLDIFCLQLKVTWHAAATMHWLN